MAYLSKAGWTNKLKNFSLCTLIVIKVALQLEIEVVAGSKSFASKSWLTFKRGIIGSGRKVVNTSAR